MKKTIILSVVIFLLFNVASLNVKSCEESHLKNTEFCSENLNYSNEIKILVIIPDRFGANTFFNLDNMEHYGWNVTLAGLTETVEPCPWAHSSLGIPELTVDILIQDISDITEFNVLAIMPATWRSGEAYGDLLDSVDTLNLISSAKTNGLVIWATCAGVRVLAAADIINGVEVTGRIQYKSEYEAAGAIYLGENIPPVIDQNIITSMRGQYWNKENIEAMSTALEQQISTVKINNINKENIKQISNNNDGGLWTKTYGGFFSDGAKKIYTTDNDKYIIVGYTFSFGFGNSDVYAVCINEKGEMIWSNTYGGAGWEYGYDICNSNNGGYLLTGYSTSYNTDNSKDVFIVKINENGDESWSKTYGGSGLDIGKSICRSDDGYMICGYTESFGAGENDIYIIHIDESGNVLWEKQFGGTGAELGYEIKRTYDHNYIVIGASGSDRANYDFYVLKINNDGDIIWENYFGAPGGDGGYDRGHSIIETSDGDFLAVGETNYGDALNILVVKIDAEGNDEWKKIYGEALHDHADSIMETSDGNYVLCGRLDKTSTGKNDIGLIKINDEGEEIWKKIMSMSCSEWATSVIETSDNDLLIAGHTNSIGSGSYDMFVMKTDSEGNANQQPYKPDPPTGPESGSIKESQSYIATAEDPENEDIYFLFDWGDGSDSGWLGPYNSGNECEASHSWDTKGEYQIKVKVRDVNGGESEWSDPLSVSMPKINERSHPLMSWIFKKLIDQFPFFEIIFHPYAY